MCRNINCFYFAVGTWVSVQLAQTAIPMMIGISNTILAMSALVPITNRSGSALNADLVIGIISGVTCIMIISNLVCMK